MSRIVIITGASRGIGLSLVKRFIEEGDQVIGISRTEKNWEVARAAVNQSDRLRLVALDLANETDISQFANDLAGQKIDILINNAGYADGLTRIEDLALADLNHNWEQNCVTAFLMSRAIIPLMQKQKSGLIINISSMAGKRSVPQLFSYSASKFAVVALSQCIAKENADFGIQSFTVCPGGVNTDMRASIFGKEDAQRQQSPDFVADVIMKTISGEIPVDSGGDIVIRHGEVTAVNAVPAP